MSNNGIRTDWMPDSDYLRGRNPDLALAVPDALIQVIAERTAAIVADRLPDAPEPYLDVDGAAGYLSCPRNRIYDLRRQGLPHFKDGSRLLFRREDLDGWLSRSE